MSTETAATVNADDLRTVLNQRIGHSHSRPGIWDDDNVRSGLAGKPCEECAARERLTVALNAASPELRNAEVYASSLRADLDRAEQALKAVRDILHGAQCDGCALAEEIGEAIDDAFTVSPARHVREWLAGAVDPGDDGETVDSREELLQRLNELRGENDE